MFRSFFGRLSRGVLSTSRKQRNRRKQRRAAFPGGLPRQMRVEFLEQRQLLAVDAFLDGVTGHVTVGDTGAGTGTEHNNVTLSFATYNVGGDAGVQPGLLIADPDGASGFFNTSSTSTFVPQFYDPDGIVNGSALVPMLTAIVDIDLQSGDDDLTFANNVDSVPVVTTYNVFGGDNSAGSDVLNLNGTTGAVESVTIGPDGSNPDETNITGYAGVNINSRGFEVVSYVGEGANDRLEVQTGDGDNVARVEQNDRSNAGDRVVSNSLPTVEYDGLNTFRLAQWFGYDSATFVLAGLDGAAHLEVESSESDVVIVEGREGGLTESFDVTNPNPGYFAVTTSGNTLTEVSTGSGTARLELRTLGGDDTVTINNTGGDGLISNPIAFDGGVGSDHLLVAADIAATTSLEFTPGMDASAGRLDYDAGWMTIEYTGLEQVTGQSAAPLLVVNGTNDKNSITVVGTGTNSLTVSVDGGPAISYADVTALVIDGLAGDDDIDIDINTLALGLNNFTVRGGLPSVDLDTVTVTGVSGNGMAAWTPNFVDGGTLAVEASTILITGTERLIYDGEDGNKTLTVNGTAANDRFIHTPGGAGDAGLISVTDIGNDDAGLGIEYVNLGLQGQINLNGAGGASNILVARGTASTDAFTLLPTTGTVQLQSTVGNSAFARHVPLVPTSLQELWLDALDGDDAFSVNGPQPYSGGIVLLGGDPSASDVAYLNGDGSAVTYTTGMEPQMVSGGGFGTVLNPLQLLGVETVNLNALAGSITINGTAAPNAFAVSPTGTNTATITVAGINQALHTTNTGALLLAENTTNDGDAVTVHGTAGDETITVVRAATTTVTVTGRKQVSLTAANVEALTVAAGQGGDTIDVSGTVGPALTVLGGDPIGGSNYDRLRIAAAAESVVVNAGPESDAGQAVLGGSAPISFDEIESFVVTGTGVAGNTVTINGTEADNDISVVGDLADADTYTVSIDGGLPVQFVNMPTLTVNGLAGDDDIDIDVNALDLTSFVVYGGLPSTNGDIVTVTGVAGLTNDNTIWAPTDNTPDEGRFTIGPQASLIDLRGVERVIYDGEAEDETLLVQGTGVGDRFTHAPGAARDAGAFTIDNGGTTLLGLEYVNLGLAAPAVVRVDGLLGLDTLVALGTDGSDSINVAFTGLDAIDVDLTSALGTHIDLLSTSVESYEIRALEGDDDINVLPLAQLTPLVHASIAFAVLGGGPGAGSDSLNVTGTVEAEDVTIQPQWTHTDDQYISGLGTWIEAMGIELITYNGVDDLDTLKVNPGAGDHAVRVDNASLAGVDRVLSDSLPEIQFTRLDIFQVYGASVLDGSVTATFVTSNLEGAANYETDLEPEGRLIIEGREGLADRYTVKRLDPNNVFVNVAVLDELSGVTVSDVTVVQPVGRLEINTLSGDDRVLVSVADTPLVTVPITFDGGANSDTLRVEGTPATGATAATYSPGPAVTEGRLQHVGGGTMTIDIVNLEPVIDTVPGTLTVQGTDADNAIDYRARAGNGLVSVDAFESIEFSNKTALTLNGNAGADVIHLNAGIVSPVGALYPLAGITVNGNHPTAEDTLIVNGTVAAVLTVDHATSTITNAEPVPITYGTISGITVLEGSSTDLAVTGSVDYTVNPGAETDQGQILSGGVPITFDGYGLTDTITLTGTGMVTVNGTDANDILSVANVAVGTNRIAITGRANIDATTLPTATVNGYSGDDTFSVNGNQTFTTLNVNGGDPDDEDILSLTNNAGAATINLGARTVTGYGGTIHYTGLQTIAPNANGQSLTVVATADNDTLVVTPFGGNAGTLQNNGVDPVVNYTNVAANTINVNLDSTTSDDLLVVNATPAADIGIVVNETNSTIDTGTFGGLVNYLAGAPDAITVNGLQGADTFTVTTGSIPVFLDGGDPIGVLPGDAVVITLTTAAAVTASVGPQSDEGAFVVGTNAPVSYDHIESATVTAVAPGSSLTVLATNADNDINVVGTDTDDFTVSIDGGPAVQYNNFGTATIDGLAGDDDIDFAANGLTSTAFTLQGNDPSTGGGDTVTVTGLAGAANDNAVYTPGPTTVDGGALAIAGLTALNAVQLAGIEALVYDGQNGNETLTVNGTTNGDTIVHTPGQAIDAGTVAVNSLLPITYTNLGAAGTVTIDGQGGTNTLVARGHNTNDAFTVAATTGTVDLVSYLGNHVDLIRANLQTLTLDGLDGDDTFTLNAPQPYAAINVWAGDPSGSDSVTVNGLATPDTLALTLAALGDSVTGVATGPVTLVGVENLTVNALADADTLSVTNFGGVSDLRNVTLNGGGTAGDTLTVTATTADDDVTVTVYSATSGRLEHGAMVQKAGEVQRDAEPPTITYTGIVAPLAVNLDTGEDTLLVVGNALAQTFNINADAALAGVDFGAPYGIVPPLTVQVDDNNNGSLDGTVAFTAATESLQVYGLEGDDRFHFTPGLIPVFVDGGDPVGTSAGDLIVVLANAHPIMFEPGPESDEGGFVYGGTAGRLSWDHIEAIGPVISPTSVVVLGTNGDDDITVLAKDDSYHAGADGVRDFTVSVNSGPEILYLNVGGAGPVIGQLHIDALAGDDDIILRAPADNDAGWSMLVEVVGGAPSDGADNEGDRLVVETPGTDTVYYTPSGSDTGTILIDENANATFDIGDTQIVIGAIVNADPPINYNSTQPPGIELFEYDGEGGNDTFSIVGTAGADTITHTPGTASDEGTLRVNTRLGVNYQNLGAGALVRVDGGAGTDTLIAQGTAGRDTFTVDSVSALIGQIRFNGHVPLQTTNALATANTVERYQIDTLEGDDTVTVDFPLATGVTHVTVNAGGPGGSDVLTVNGAAGTDEAFTVDPDFTPGDGTVTVNAVGLPYSGIEHILLDANPADNDDLVVNDDEADNFWRVNAGPIYGDRIQIDDRESIDYVDFNDVRLNDVFGTDWFAIHPTELTGFDGAFTVNGNANLPVDDVLEIVGTPAADTVDLLAPDVLGTLGRIAANGVTITAGAYLVEARITALAGDDTVTAAADTLAGVRRVVDAGDGDDSVNLAGLTSAGPVLIFGGQGNDVLVGADIPVASQDPGDTIDGGLGDDRITGGIGNDRLFGGDGSDIFVWDQGDNSDLIEGDGGGADVLVFNGATAAQVAAETYTLSAGTATASVTGARFRLARAQGSVVMDVAGVEQVDLNGQDGAETISVLDLTQTEVQVLNINLGTTMADTAADVVTVEGRTVADQVTLSRHSGADGTAGNADDYVNIAGLRYDVNIDNGNGNDLLVFNGNEGDDTLISTDTLITEFPVNSVTAGGAPVTGVAVTGGDGNDSITGYGSLYGNAGNDVIMGGAFGQLIHGGDGDDQLYGGGGDDILRGGAGEDLFVGGAGNDTINGNDVDATGVPVASPEWDTILIQGTSGGDTITVNQTTATTLVYTVNGNTQTDTLALDAGTRTVEEARIEAGSGADLIRVQNADFLAVDAFVNSLQMTVHGGTQVAAGDRLVIVDNGLDDLVLYRKDQDDAAGTVTIGPLNAEPFENIFDSIERVQFVDENAVAINQEPGNLSRLVVFKHDPFEYNDDRFVATHIGANATVNVDPTIDPGALPDDTFQPADADTNPDAPGDADWYRVEAEVTGTLDFQVFFEEVGMLASGRPGLPGNGNLNIELYDVDGNPAGVPLVVTPIAGNGPNFGINDGAGDFNNVDGDSYAENERIRIPAVAGQVYYLKVFGVGTAINNYTMTVINTAAAVPYDLELADIVATSTVASATATTFTANADPSLNATDGFYTGKYVYFTSGNDAGYRAVITGYTALTRTFTVAAGVLPAVPAVDSSFVVETHDTGRSQLENVTRDDTPVIRFRLDDALFLHDLPGNAANDMPPDEVIPIPFNAAQTRDTSTAGYRVAVFIEGTPQYAGTLPPQLPQVPVGYARQLAEGVYEFDFGRDAINYAGDPNGATTAFSLASNNGSYFLSAKVQMIDPADNDTAPATVTPAVGFGDRSVSLEIVVDTVPPPVWFGIPTDATDGLRPDSDTGILWQPESFDDRLTADTTPTFWGLAEADSIVRLYVDVNGNGTIQQGVDYFIGETVAVPLDGTNQFPTGQWELTSVVDMNDNELLAALWANSQLPDGTRDGLRHILATAEDVAGNVSTPPQALDIFIDTQGPQITDVDINNLNNPYDLFDPKPSTDGPTPLVDRLVVSIRDLPPRAANWLYAAIKTHPEAVVDWVGGVATAPRLLETGFFTVAGDANGLIPIYHVTFTSDGNLATAPANDALTAGNPATGYITIWFSEAGTDGLFGTPDDIRHPLPDDRYTLTITDDIRDYAGNRLDGESNADEPHEQPEFPTGDELPGGDFVARFTIDSRPEIGTDAAGSVWVDTNGNFHFDPQNLDYTNRDITYTVYYQDPISGVLTDRFVTTDDIFAGNFSPIGAASADDFDKLAAYGRIAGAFRWLVDTNNDGVAEVRVVEQDLNGLPVAGNFNGSPADGDEVGLLVGTTWWFDTNHDYRVDHSIETPNLSGLPIVGDFDGNGVEDLGTWKDDRFTFLMNPNIGPLAPVSQTIAAMPLAINFGFIGVREKPVAADMDKDGIDDIGLWTPDRSGVTPEEGAEWYFLISDKLNATPAARAALFGTVNALNHPFEPVPFGADRYALFGDEFALPIVGNFDPPTTTFQWETLPVVHTNPLDAADVNYDGQVSAIDALVLITELNRGGSRQLTVSDGAPPYLDPSGDGWLTAFDVLDVITVINGKTSSGGEGEALLVASAAPVAAAAGVVEVAAPDWTGSALVTTPVVQTRMVDRYFTAAAQPEARDDTPVWTAAESTAASLATASPARAVTAALDLEKELALLAADLDQARAREQAADAFFRNL